MNLTNKYHENMRVKSLFYGIGRIKSVTSSEITIIYTYNNKPKIYNIDDFKYLTSKKAIIIL